MINDFELHVDLPEARVAVWGVYLRGTHASLLGDETDLGWPSCQLRHWPWSIRLPVAPGKNPGAHPGVPGPVV